MNISYCYFTPPLGLRLGILLYVQSCRWVKRSHPRGKKNPSWGFKIYERKRRCFSKNCWLMNLNEQRIEIWSFFRWLLASLGVAVVPSIIWELQTLVLKVLHHLWLPLESLFLCILINPSVFDSFHSLSESGLSKDTFADCLISSIPPPGVRFLNKTSKIPSPGLH